MFALCLSTIASLAQEPPPSSAAAGAANRRLERDLLVPAGTRMNVVLARQISSTSTHTGDELQGQITSPVVADSQFLIPAGTYLQGKIGSITQQKDQVRLMLESTSLVFANGYMAAVPGPIELQSDAGWVQPATTGGAKGALAFSAALLGGGALGAAIGRATGGSTVDNPANGNASNNFIVPAPFMPTPLPAAPPGHGVGNLKGAMIGSVVGTAGGLVIGLALLHVYGHHGPNFLLNAGSPMDTTLQTAVLLDKDRVADAVTQAHKPAVQEIIPPNSRTTGAGKDPWSCSAGEEWCGGSCVSSIRFVNDSANCGRCGNRCSFSETCTGGSCSCGPGYSTCMGSCTSDVSFLSDSGNCGRCGNQCSIGETCMGGSCTRTSPCTPGDITCH